MEKFEHLSTTTTLPGRYAATLFALALQNNALSQVQANFKDFLATLRSHAELKNLISSALINKTEQHDIVTQITEKLKCEALFVTFLQLLVDNRRLTHLETIYTAFDELIDENAQSVRFTISCAQALTTVQKERLSDLLSKRWGTNIHLEYIIDTKLLAGFIVRTGNQVVDFSVANQLHRLASAMKGHA